MLNNRISSFLKNQKPIENDTNIEISLNRIVDVKNYEIIHSFPIKTPEDYIVYDTNINILDMILTESLLLRENKIVGKINYIVCISICPINNKDKVIPFTYFDSFSFNRKIENMSNLTDSDLTTNFEDIDIAGKIISSDIIEVKLNIKIEGYEIKNAEKINNNKIQKIDNIKSENKNENKVENKAENIKIENKNRPIIESENTEEVKESVKVNKEEKQSRDISLPKPQKERLIDVDFILRTAEKRSKGFVR
jgi:hypothetical protein